MKVEEMLPLHKAGHILHHIVNRELQLLPVIIGALRLERKLGQRLQVLRIKRVHNKEVLRLIQGLLVRLDHLPVIRGVVLRVEVHQVIQLRVEVHQVIQLLQEVLDQVIQLLQEVHQVLRVQGVQVLHLQDQEGRDSWVHLYLFQ